MTKEKLLQLSDDLADSFLKLSKISYVIDGKIVKINDAPEITQILKNILKASRELKTQWEQT